MTTVIVAVIAALGSSGLAAALVSWWKDRDKDDAEVTDLIRKMSKETVADARSEMSELRAHSRAVEAELREVKLVLRDVARVLEFEVLPLLQDHPVVSERLHVVAASARNVV